MSDDADDITGLGIGLFLKLMHDFQHNPPSLALSSLYLHTPHGLLKVNVVIKVNDADGIAYPVAVLVDPDLLEFMHPPSGLYVPAAQGEVLHDSPGVDPAERGRRERASRPQPQL